MAEEGLQALRIRDDAPEQPATVIAEAERTLFHSNDPTCESRLYERLLSSPQLTIKALRDRGWTGRGAAAEEVNSFLIRALGRFYKEGDDGTRKSAADMLVGIFDVPDDNTTGWVILLQDAAKALSRCKVKEAREELVKKKSLVDGRNIQGIDYAIQLLDE